MNFEIKGTTALVFKSTMETPEFFKSFELIYPQIKPFNIIILVADSNVKDVVYIDRIKEASKAHQKLKRSFVLVCSQNTATAFSDTLIVVPTLKEAYDFIEMDEIQRDLGFLNKIN